MSPVHCYTEWGKLEEVIIASCYNFNVAGKDLSFKLLYHDSVKHCQDNPIFWDQTDYSKANSRFVDEREEDLDGLENVLKDFGVIVRKPKRLDSLVRFKTPYWEGMCKPVDNPRDQVLIAGEEIIETPYLNRSRFFENDLLKHIFYDYWYHGAKWTSAPRPMMLDESFDTSYVNRQGFDYAVHNDVSKFEIMFDAANCFKFGKHIVMNVSTYNHEMGAEWLQRHLDGKFIIHVISITDSHIDGCFMPLRPGTLLVDPDNMKGKLDKLPDPLKKWDKIFMTPDDKDKTQYTDDELILTSTGINVNVLPLDEEHVIINEDSPNAIKMLEKNGFTPIPIRFRHSRLFAGGIHCATLDIRRQGGPEDYFE